MQTPKHDWKPEDILKWTEYYIEHKRIKKTVQKIIAKHYTDFFNIVRVLCREIVDQPSSMDKAELKNLRRDLSLCKNKNEGLLRDLSAYKSQNERLKKELEDPDSLWRRINRIFSSSKSELRTKQREIDNLNKTLAGVNQEKKELEDKFQKTLTGVKQEKKELEDKFQKLLSGKAAKNADRGRTSVRILADTTPEDYQMVNKYKNFCTNGPLATVSDDIFSYKVKIDPSVKKENYLLHIPKITSSLSDNILMESFRVLTSSTTGNIDVESFFEMPCEEFDTLGDKIYSNIGIPPANTNKNALKLLEQIEKTAEQGFNLVKDIINATPAELFKAEKGQKFNDESYEVAIGCKKEGIIKFTVIPGLRSGNHVSVKPIVFTECSELPNKT